MAKPIRNEPKANVPSEAQATRKGPKTPYESTTKKVTAAAGNVDLGKATETSMKERKVTQKVSGDNLSSLVTKGSGRQRALEVAKVATPIFTKPSLANKKKIRSAHIATSNPKVDATSKKVLGKS